MLIILLAPAPARCGGPDLRSLSAAVLRHWAVHGTGTPVCVDVTVVTCAARAEDEGHFGGVVRARGCNKRRKIKNNETDWLYCHKMKFCTSKKQINMVHPQTEMLCRK